jgi:hypothetical protein
MLQVDTVGRCGCGCALLISMQLNAGALTFKGVGARCNGFVVQMVMVCAGVNFMLQVFTSVCCSVNEW